MATPDAAAPGPTIDELVIADDPACWAELGFALDRDRCQLGAVRVRLTGPSPRRGIVGWSLREIGPGPLDALIATRSLTHRPGAAPPHPNGIIAIDHVVAVSSDLQRTVAALAAAGLPLRRIREQPSATGAPRQAFFRLGDEILEVVQAPAAETEPDRPARLWGLALLADDLQRTVATFGEHVSEIRPAVQRGRSIATVRRSAGLTVPMALISRRSA